MSRRVPLAISSGVLVAVAVAAAAAWTSAGVWIVAASIALAFVLAGAASVSWSHVLRSGDADESPRADGGPELSHRRMFLRFGLGTAALAAAGVSVPAARRIERSVDELKRTSWRDGSVVVDADGEPVMIERIRDGEMLTVYPHDAVGSVDSQAVLIREPIERFAAADRPRVVDGVVIHSKLCTHMACSLGLYQQTSGTLLCPCHQAVFDVLDHGQPISGPARRPLPRLPFRRRADGLLVATGDFDGVVGSGFWWRP